MPGLKVVLQDQTEEDDDVTLAIDANGVVTVTTQKVLVNDTKGTSEPEGDPITTELNAEDSAAFVAALQPLLNPIVVAIEAGTYASTAAPAEGASTSEAAQ